MLDDIALQLAREYITREEWTFAKTVPDQPHEYVMAFDTRDPEGYQWFGRLIMDEGDLRPWTIPGTNRTRKYRYLTIDGYDYWVIFPGRGTPSMNRRVHVPPVAPTP